MVEITQMIQQKTGLSQEQSAEVTQAVMGIIEAKIPPQFRGMVAPFLGLQGGAPGAEGAAAPAESGGLGSLLGAASSFFGSKS